MNKSLIFTLLLVTFVLIGCTKEGRYLPITPGVFGIALPAQQKTVAQAVENGVTKADFAEFAPLKGKTAFIEVSGVLAASAEFYKYVRHNLEAKFADLGVKIVPLSYNFSQAGEIAVTYPNADYRILVTLSAAGADSETKDWWTIINLLGKNDEYYYVGKIEGTVIAYPLVGEVTSIKKAIKGDGERVQIEGMYTKAK